MAAGAILYYLDMTHHENLGHINRISRIEEEKYVWLDRFTVRNLELFHSPYEGAKTLIDIVDRTLSPMGGRMMKRWISLPLKDIEVLNTRLDIVDFLMRTQGITEEMEGLIREVGDLERLLSKAAVGRVTPREVAQVRRALTAIGELKRLCSGSDCQPLVSIASGFDPMSGTGGENRPDPDA